jgi:hypothetical protein
MVQTLPKSLSGIEVKILVALVLYYYDPKLPIIVETDTSDLTIDTFLTQQEDRVKPEAFYSRKIHITEFDSNIYYTEIFTIVSGFKEWKRYLKGAEYPILIFLDYKNLEYITTTNVLNNH